MIRGPHTVPLAPTHRSSLLAVQKDNIITPNFLLFNKIASLEDQLKVTGHEEATDRLQVA